MRENSVTELNELIRLLKGKDESALSSFLAGLGPESIDVNYQDEDGNSAFHYAVTEGWPIEVFVTLSKIKNADPNLLNNRLYTPFMLATRQIFFDDIKKCARSLEDCQQMRKAGAKPYVEKALFSGTGSLSEKGWFADRRAVKSQGNLKYYYKKFGRKIRIWDGIPGSRNKLTLLSLGGHPSLLVFNKAEYPNKFRELNNAELSENIDYFEVDGKTENELIPFFILLNFSHFCKFNELLFFPRSLKLTSIFKFLNPILYADTYIRALASVLPFEPKEILSQLCFSKLEESVAKSIIDTLISRGLVITKKTKYLSSWVQWAQKDQPLANLIQGYIDRSPEETLSASEHRLGLLVSQAFAVHRHARQVPYKLAQLRPDAPVDTRNNKAHIPPDRFAKIREMVLCQLPKLEHSFSLIETIKHGTHVQNLNNILNQGVIWSRQRAEKQLISFHQGILGPRDAYCLDRHLVCTFMQVCALKDGPNTSTLIINTRQLSRQTLSSIYFKFCDWSVEFSYNIPLFDSIKLIYSNNPKASQNSFYGFVKGEKDPVWIELPKYEEIFHGFNGLASFIYTHIFRILDYLAAMDQALFLEIHEEFESLNENEIHHKLMYIATQLLKYSELDFVNKLELPVPALIEIQFSTHTVFNVPHYVKQVLAAKGEEYRRNFSHLKDLGAFDIRIKRNSTIQNKTANANTLALSRGLSFFVKRKNSHAWMESINELLKFMTRAPESDNPKKSVVFQVSEDKVHMEFRLNLDRDIRTNSTLQYDAERLLILSLGPGDIFTYDPNPSSLNFSYIKFQLGNRAYSLGKDHILKGKIFHSLAELYQAMLQSILNLTVSGYAYADESLDPEHSLRPNQVSNPATSYLNAHDSVLQSLKCGKVATEIHGDLIKVISLKNVHDYLIRVFELNSIDLKIGEENEYRYFMCAPYALARQIKLTAMNYFGLSLVDEKSGNLLLLLRHHPHQQLPLGFDCSCGGSSPFPHDPLKSILATLSWKLGIPSEIIKSYSEGLRFSKSGDSFYGFMPISSDLLMKLDHQFYHRDRISWLSPQNMAARKDIPLNPKSIHQYFHVFKLLAKDLSNFIEQEFQTAVFVKIIGADVQNNFPGDHFARIRIKPVKDAEILPLKDFLQSRLPQETHILISHQSLIIDAANPFCLIKILEENVVSCAVAAGLSF